MFGLYRQVGGYTRSSHHLSFPSHLVFIALPYIHQPIGSVFCVLYGRYFFSFHRYLTHHQDVLTNCCQFCRRLLFLAPASAVEKGTRKPTHHPKPRGNYMPRIPLHSADFPLLSLSLVSLYPLLDYFLPSPSQRRCAFFVSFAEAVRGCLILITLLSLESQLSLVLPLSP